MSETTDIVSEALRRRTFAIISHPDAGKTTLTEKLLLYGGALAEAGSVDGRKSARAATSDWMDLERRRGISVSATAMRFHYRGTVFNLVDTPGHGDFSEDTLRALSAVDGAVILLDAAKGIESQTLRLFEVARSRGMPLVTFINKCDRPGLEPLDLLDRIESTLELIPTAVTWPVGEPGDLRGVVDRRSAELHVFERVPGGREAIDSEVMPIAEAPDRDEPYFRRALEELALLDAAGNELEPDAVAAGISTPVFFGSALTNFGVELLLETLSDLTPPPGPRSSVGGDERPIEAPFSAQVFKVQANMDPRHRDRSAFLRICSGRFERGMRVVNSRSGKPVALTYSSESLGRERETLDEAYPGDIVGIVNAGDLRVGDTVYSSGPVSFPPLPSLVPEHFMRIRNVASHRHKQYAKALDQLAREGVVHVMTRDGGRDPNPILGAVGRLQFEVALERMRTEFGVEVAGEETEWNLARLTDEDGAAVIEREGLADLRTRTDGTRFALFRSRFELERLMRDRPEIELRRLI